MLRLVWKDVVVAGWVLLAALPLYAIQLAGAVAIPPVALLLTVVFTALFAFGSIVLEEIQGTETLWCSLPLSRADLVRGRYAATALGIVLGLVSSWGITRFASGLVFGGSRAEAGPLGSGAYLVLLALFLFLGSLFLPCYFRFGAGRGLFVFGAVLFGLLVLCTALGSVIPRSAVRALLSEHGSSLAVGGTALAAVAFGASTALSVRLYAKRDC